MRLGKKIIGIVMSAFTLLLAVLFVILAIEGTTSVIDLANYMSGKSSYIAEQLGKQMTIEVMRLLVAVALAVMCGVMGGINLGKAIKGRPEAMLNRLGLFVAFDFCGTAAALGYLFAYVDKLNGDYIASIIAYTITMLVMIISISVVATMARRRALAPGRKLAAGIMLAVVTSLMAAVLIIEGAAAPEIVAPRYSAYTGSQSIRDLYTAFELIASLVGICGTTAFAALTIVEAILEKRRGVQPAKVEEKPAEK